MCVRISRKNESRKTTKKREKVKYMKEKHSKKKNMTKLLMSYLVGRREANNRQKQSFATEHSSPAVNMGGLEKFFF